MILKLKYWFIRKLIGDMPVIANCEVFDEDFEVNFSPLHLKDEPFMFYSNYSKKLDWVINKAILTSRTSDPAVIRTYNDKYVLEPVFDGYGEAIE